MGLKRLKRKHITDECDTNIAELQPCSPNINYQIPHLLVDRRSTPPILYDKHPNGLPRKPVGVLHPGNKIFLHKNHKK